MLHQCRNICLIQYGEETSEILEEKPFLFFLLYIHNKQLSSSFFKTNLISASFCAVHGIASSILLEVHHYGSF